MIDIYIGPVLDTDVHGKDIIILNDVKAYADCRLRIREAIQQSQSLLVWVNEPICYEWFWDIESSSQVRVYRLSLVDRLRQKLGVQTLPAFLYDNSELIIDWNLLDVSEAILPTETVLDWIFRTQLGPVWVEVTPTKAHFAQLVDWLVANEIKETFVKITWDRLEYWSNNAQEKVLKIAYKELLQSPVRKAKTLICHNLLSGYPRDQIMTWLKTQEWFSDGLLMPDYFDLRFSSIPIELQRDISPYIDKYWNAYFRQHDIRKSFADQSEQKRLQIIENILATMTCRLDVEIDILTKFVMDNIECVPRIVSSQIRERFSQNALVNTYIQKIEEAVPPKYPNNPDESWNETLWLEWAISEYLPYRKWAIFNAKEDDQLDHLSSIFEEWLFQNYPKLAAQASPKLVSNTPAEVRRLLDEGQRVLWLFMDNLSYLWYSDLLDALDDAGFLVEASQPQIAMIPSITEVSRSVALVGGTPSTNMRRGLDKWQNLFKAIEDYWASYTVEVVRKLVDLDTSVTKMPDMIIFVYNRLDELMHDSLETSDRKHETKSVLKRLVNELRLAVDRLSHAGRVSMIISTDHGCTSIKQELDPLELPSFVKQEPSFDLHRRYVRYENNQHLDNAAWFILDPQYYELPEYFATPRGRRSVGAYPKGLTHGGLTPEEVVVPVITCQVGMQQRISVLHFNQVSPLRSIERQQKLVLELYNPLDTDLSQVEIAIPALQGIFEVVSQLEKRESEEIVAVVMLPSSSQDTIETDIVYQALVASGRRISGKVTIMLTISKIYKSEMDDLFG